MKWNYRIVNTKTLNNGDDFYCLQEVFYNEAGVPYAYSEPCTGDETEEGVRHVFSMMNAALEQPFLQESDFVGAPDWETDEDSLDEGDAA